MPNFIIKLFIYPGFAKVIAIFQENFYIVQIMLTSYLEVSGGLILLSFDVKTVF